MTDNYILKYYQAIKDGSITVGKYIDQLYTYIVKGLEDKSFFYDHKKAIKAIRFIESFCHHSKGSLAPQLIKLELWQKALISLIFGIVDADGLRQFREVVIVVGRKCGKSLLASGIAENMAYADGEFGADIYFLAPKLDQADIVFNDFCQSVMAEPELMSLTKSRKTDWYIKSTNTSIKKLAFNQKKADGFNPHLTVNDEVAAWPAEAGLKQYEVMASALGARSQPLILSITTANYVDEGIYDELICRGTRVLEGGSNEKRLLPVFYMIDDIDKWNDISELQKSLPNLGVSVSVDFMLEEIAKAEQSLSKRAEFLTKYCNVKQNSSQALLSYKDVEKACGEPLNIKDFAKHYCFAGIDLSQTTDLTACNAIFEKDGHFYIFSKFFLPAEKLDEATARDGLPYRKYIEQGFLQLSGENLINYHDCFEFYRELLQDYNTYPLEIGYDRYSASYLITELNEAGFHTDDVYQGHQLYPIIKDFEGLLKDGRIHIGNNNLLKVHMLNAGLKMDRELNRGKLIKIHPNDHIDGFAAVIDAFTVRSKYWNEYGYLWSNK